MRITCPFCGLRDLAEYTYYGDASRERPSVDNTDPEAWSSYVYERDNPKGPHKEFWHHLHGCRQWLVVERNTATHEILSVEAARDVALRKSAGAKA